MKINDYLSSARVNCRTPSKPTTRTTFDDCEGSNEGGAVSNA